MGAAFSTSIANIYMSTVLNKFLQAQKAQPLLFMRCIDDIFMIWKDTKEELNTFVTNLNLIHPNLKFTHEYSEQTIDFLDLTVYKGRGFLFTNRLDTKTFQKPLNLYQYIPSFHLQSSSQSFKALIKGEMHSFCTNYHIEGNVRCHCSPFQDQIT